MEKIEIKNQKSILDVSEAYLSDSRFTQACLERLYFEDVTLAGSKITNANLSDLEIEGAQLGGAFIHNIGMPPKGHPMYDPVAKQRPLKFENCDLSGSVIQDCNLSGVELRQCTLSGMSIDGILIEDLIAIFKKNNV
ncbi:MAG: pentapeptide repeat-containing protein [Saprospiraceae bacterium]